MHYVRLALILLLISVQAQAVGSARCMARVIKDVPADGNSTFVMRRGVLFGPVTQMVVDRDEGHVLFCAHGSSCYDSSAFEFTSACTMAYRPGPMDKRTDPTWIIDTF